MLGLEAPELIVIAIVILIVIAGSQLPKLARFIGTSSKETPKDAQDEVGSTPDTTDVKKDSKKKS